MFLSLRRVLFLVCHSWLYCLKRAVWVALLGVILSSMRLALSENDVGPDEGEEGNGSNSSIVPVCPTNVSCVELPVYCLDCTFDESCVYGNLTEAVCTPLESVECEGQTNFTAKFTCQYCYQLPEEDTDCTTNTSCNVRGTTNSLYIANCTACDRTFCLPPRNFTKQHRCSHSSGLRWSTAFLLSFALGGFGVDRFYLNHWGAACGKLISFGGLGVWSILDVILIGTGYLGPADGSAYVF